MAFPVFSTRFISTALGGSGTVAFLVPAGFRAVLRDLDIFESNPGGAIVEAAGQGGVVFWAAGPSLTTTFNVYQWRGRLVVDPGGQIEVSTTLAVNVYASGYLLTLP